MRERPRSPNLRIGLIALSASSAVGLIALFKGAGHATLTFFCLMPIAIVTGLILANIRTVQSLGLALYAERPLTVYSAFFFLYYVPAYLMFFFSDGVPTHNHAKIALLILLGYVGFWCGMRISPADSKVGQRPLRLSFSQAEALLLFAYFGAAMVLVHYTWLAATQGYYYTHAMMYVQPATVVGSVAYVFAGSFDLPLVLLLGLLTKVTDPSFAKRARRFFWLYVLMLLFVFITSSQFRLTLTLIVFVLMSVQLGKGLWPKARYCAAAVALSVFALIVINSTRVFVPVQDLPSSNNQLLASTRASFAALKPAFQGDRSEIGTSVSQRAILPIQFLSDIIDATDAGREHTHGTVALENIESLLPRALWPGKPTFLSTQIQIEKKLGLPELDNSPGPINEFYAEFGLTGVVLGYAAFGWLLGFLTEYGFNSNRLLGWFIIFWLWSAIAIVETDLVSGVFMSLRQALVVYLIYRICLVFVAQKRGQQAALRSLVTTQYCGSGVESKLQKT